MFMILFTACIRCRQDLIKYKNEDITQTRVSNEENFHGSVQVRATSCKASAERGSNINMTCIMSVSESKYGLRV